MYPAQPLLTGSLRKRFLLTPLLVSLMAASSPCNALAEEAAPQVPLSIYCIEYATALKSVYLKTGGGEFTKTDLSTANVVAAGDVPVENGAISLYGPPMENVDHPLVSSARPEAIRQPLMVLVPGAPGNEPAYQNRLVDMSLTAFPAGSYMIVNLSPHPLRIKFDGNDAEIAPDSEKLFNPSVKPGEVTAVTVEYKIGEDWLPVSSSRWASRKDRRSLVCIYKNPLTERMLIKSIPLRH